MKPLLHDLTNRQIEAALRAGAGGYIFHGARSAGKAASARYFARRLNCRGDETGLCLPCRQFEAGTYPDYTLIQPEDRPSITIEQIRTLGHALSLSSYHSTGSRVVIIDEAHTLTVEAQNALLKLIEEPPPATRFVLIAEQLEALLPTVRSRLSAVYFAPVPASAIAQLLSTGSALTPDQAAQLAQLADGAPGVAVHLAQDPGAATAHAELNAAVQTALSAPLFDRLVLARRLAESKADLLLWARHLQRALLGEVHAPNGQPVRAATRLAALEQFRRGLSGGLGRRVAIERLMLEL